MDVHVEIAAETLFHVGPIPITNSMLTMFIVMGLLLFFGWLIAKRAADVPSHSQSILELVVEFILSLAVGTAGQRQGRRIFPLIGGLFIFIIVANYAGLLPGVGTIGYYPKHENGASASVTPTQPREQIQVFDVAATGNASSVGVTRAADDNKKVLVPFLRAPNSDINMTLAMALVSFTVVQILGIRAHGVGGRIKHMANPPFLFPIEAVSELSRIISLSARLFGNVFAGEVLLGVMYAMANAIKIAVIPLLFPVVFIFLELLFGAIQALVFALLTLIYIVLATEGGHDAHEEHAHGDAPGGVPATVSHAPAD
jgi:F-type H+-transporting ATPase subunit a